MARYVEFSSCELRPSHTAGAGGGERVTRSVAAERVGQSVGESVKLESQTWINNRFRGVLYKLVYAIPILHMD